MRSFRENFDGYINDNLSSSVYSPFSDRVGLPPHNTPPPGVLMKSIVAFFTTGCPS